MTAILERPKKAVEMLMGSSTHTSVELLGGPLDGKRISNGAGYIPNPVEVYIISKAAYRPVRVEGGVLLMMYDPAKTAWYAKLSAKKGR